MRTPAAAGLSAGLLFACLAAPAQAWSGPVGAPAQPEAVVQGFYVLVLAHRLLGVDSPHVLDVFGPYLSQRLIREIRSARLCERDWDRQYALWRGRKPPGEILKPPFAWLELGLFSGGVEHGWPARFQVLRAEPRKGYTSVRLNLAEWGLTASGDPAPPSTSAPEETWDVAVRVVKERGRPVVDDVVYLKGEDLYFESTLSGALSMGCRGSRWVGKVGYETGFPSRAGLPHPKPLH